MEKFKVNNEARCAIIICSLVCVITIGSAVGYYFYHMSIYDADWSEWYNFTSPFIAVANVLAFIGLTVAIYIGESRRQKAQEQAKIQNAIIAKLQIMEKELSLKEESFREWKNIKAKDLYEIYIPLYRCSNYLKKLPEIFLFEHKEEERKDAKQVFEQILNTRNLFGDKYQEACAKKTKKVSGSVAQELSRQLNLSIAYLEEFEISVLQYISFDIDNPI